MPCSGLTKAAVPLPHDPNIMMMIDAVNHINGKLFQDTRHAGAVALPGYTRPSQIRRLTTCMTYNKDEPLSVYQSLT